MIRLGGIQDATSQPFQPPLFISSLQLAPTEIYRHTTFVYLLFQINTRDIYTFGSVPSWPYAAISTIPSPTLGPTINSTSTGGHSMGGELDQHIQHPSISADSSLSCYSINYASTATRYVYRMFISSSVEISTLVTCLVKLYPSSYLARVHRQPQPKQEVRSAQEGVG